MHSVRWLLPRILPRRISCSPNLRDGIINHDKVFVYWNDKLCLNPTEAKLSPLQFMNLADIQRRERAIFIPYFMNGSILKVVWTDKASPSGQCEFTGVCVYQSEDALSIGATFILRNVSKDEGVSLTFEKYSPIIRSIDLIRFQKIEWKKEGESLEDYLLSASKIPADITTLLTNKPLTLIPNKSGPVVSDNTINLLIKKKEIHIINSAKEIKEMYDPFYKWYASSQEVPKEITHEGIRDKKPVDDRHIELQIGDTK